VTTQNILIIGAGIGGLTAALSFARNGREVDIVEQAPVLSEVGAGLQISPNASRILIALGLGAPLHEAMIRPQQITLVSGQSLRKITQVPCGDFAEKRWGAPYGVMHRADLQKLLLEAVNAHPRCRLHLDQRIETNEIKTLHERFAQPRPGLVIGADGVWSQVRRLIPGAPKPRFSGQVAWRFQVTAEVAGSVLNPSNVTAFLGPNTHLVAYPLENGKTINMVAITKGTDPGETWAEHEAPTDRMALLNAFKDWNQGLVSILRNAPQMTWWPLFEVADGRWSNADGAVLIGDAAHAMTPFAAQGAAMAIEDSYELAQAFTHTAGNTAGAIERFEKQRRARISRARSRGAFNQFAYHASGPIRLGRDFVLALKSPESLASDLDWLYGYRATGL